MTYVYPKSRGLHGQVKVTVTKSCVYTVKKCLDVFGCLCWTFYLPMMCFDAFY